MEPPVTDPHIIYECPKCGKELAEAEVAADFCSKCGENVDPVAARTGAVAPSQRDRQRPVTNPRMTYECPHCGKELAKVEVAADFCPRCGAKIGSGPKLRAAARLKAAAGLGMVLGLVAVGIGDDWYLGRNFFHRLGILAQLGAVTFVFSLAMLMVVSVMDWVHRR